MTEWCVSCVTRGGEVGFRDDEPSGMNVERDHLGIWLQKYFIIVIYTNSIYKSTVMVTHQNTTIKYLRNSET